MSWERLESASVDPQLDEGLEARIADPAWLLARQWQAGEFRGEDAADPLLVELAARSVHVDRVLTGRDTVAPLSAATPLETLVEREAVRDGPGGTRLAAELGAILLAALGRAPGGPLLAGVLRRRHRIALPADDGLDPAGRRRLELLARRSLDGVALAATLRADAALADALLTEAAVPAAARPRLTALLESWRRRSTAAFAEPAGAPAWDAERLEYAFEVRAAGGDADVRLVADGYAGGRLEWHHFDRGEDARATVEPSDVVTRRAELLPLPLRFRGMPAQRFWAFEPGDVSFGGIDVGPEDLARTAVAAYATVYGDDWYLVPIQVPAATLTTITGLRVFDDFGGVTDIPAAAVVDGGAEDRPFRFFELSGDPGPAAGAPPALFLPPSLETTDAARALEDVRFVRDEVSNLAWAVEHRVEGAAGRPVDLAARAAPEEHTDEGAGGDRWRLVLSSPVPEHWVPLVPVRIGADGAIRLQRGRVPVPGGTSRGARGRILEPRRRLLLHEEEVLRTGVRVVRRFQSARATDGSLQTWIGRRKGPGRGEGSSGLAYDELQTSPPPGHS